VGAVGGEAVGVLPIKPRAVMDCLLEKGIDMFPITLNGEVSIDVTDRVDPKAVRNAIRLALEVLGARRIEADSDALRFRSTVLRLMSSTNMLAPISHGEMRIAGAPGRVTVRYHVNFWQILTAGTLLIGVVLGLPLLHAPNLSTWQASMIAAVAWLFLMGGNWILTAVRFPRFIRACADAASNEGKCLPCPAQA
jgi:hypothetical protein